MALPDILKSKLRIPVVGAPLFIISHPTLVLAQCKAGIVGSFPALNARPEAQLDEWLAEITEDLRSHDEKNPGCPAAPFAVNQIVHRSNKRLEHDLMMCVKYKVPIVISSLGAVPEVMLARFRRSPLFRKFVNGSMGPCCCRVPSRRATPFWRRRPWVPTLPISARPSSPPQKRARAMTITR